MSPRGSTPRRFPRVLPVLAGLPAFVPGSSFCRRLALTAALLLRSADAPGLDPGKPLADFGLVSWQRELPQSSVHAVLQTRDGYLWFGTFEGLVRFDGVRFTVFDRRNTKELGNGVVFALYQDRAGALWIGLRGGGVVRYQGGAFHQLGASGGLADAYVSSFAEDPSGRLWVATNAGVARLEGERFVAVPGLDLKRIRTQGLAAGRDGAMWISAESGLVRYHDGSVTTFTSRDGLTSDAVRALAVDARGALWIGTEGGGLNRFADGRFTAFTTRDGLAGDAVRALLADREGSIWAGTEGGGISRIHEGRIDSLTLRDGLPSGLVRAFCQDAEGSVWIGTNGGGVVCLKEQKITTYGARHGLANENVRAVLEDRAGTIWVGTDGGGLYRKDGARFTSVRTPDGAPGDHVRSLAEDPDGSLWVGSIGEGVARLKDGRAARLRHDGLSDPLALLAPGDGELWVGTDFSGVNRIRDGVLTRDESPAGMGGRPITAFLKDAAGAVWIASNGGGIAVHRNETITHYTREDGLPSNQVYCFHEDAAGSVWIGTDAGLCRWKDGRFASVTSANGLFDDVAFQILEDAEGLFWISCNRGIFHVSRRDLESVLEGRARTVVSTVYGVSDGMGSGQCNGVSMPSAWKARDGRLWFSTTRGLSVVNPARLPRNLHRPPVLVEDVLVDGRKLPSGNSATLAPGVDKLELHYTATSFLAPDRVRFRYRLEGYDRSWTEAGTRREAYYTGLPPGRYRFRVAACNDDGVWNEAGASFALELLPPWWRTWWAYGLAAAALVGLILGFVRLRLRQLERRTEELERKIAERTVELAASEKRALEANLAKSAFLANMSHELRTPLNGILGFAQLMERTRGRNRMDSESLAIISKSGEHLLGLINDVLSLSKIEAGHVALAVGPFDLGAFLDGLLDVVRTRAAASRVTLALDARELPEAVLGDEGKLRQVVLNLLSNAVKFSGDGSVTLRARWRDGRGILEVEDTGPGIAAAELGTLFRPFTQTESGKQSKEGTGLGLAVSRQLVRLMGGDITVKSVPGEGATFRVELELPAAAPSLVRREDPRRVVGLASARAAPRVLVVDDVAENRLLLSRLLVSVGFEVREAASGEEAISLWRAYDPDVIFMDKRMQGIGGLEATRRIREEEGVAKRRRAVIISLSASAMEHEREEILASGCDDFVAKPFREATLFEKLAEHLKLEYVFEGQEHPAERGGQALDSGRVALLPRELRQALSAAFAAGDFDAAERAAERVRELDAPLAAALRSAARDYRPDEALAALESAARQDGDAADGARNAPRVEAGG